MLNSYVKHGDFELSLSRNIIVARLAGSWNEEAARAFDRDFRQLAQSLAGSEWGHLVCLEDWSLGVPEIAPIIEGLVQWCIENGLTRAAQVYSPSMLKQLQVDDMVVEQLGEFQRCTFANKVDAIRWLAENGFELE